MKLWLSFILLSSTALAAPTCEEQKSALLGIAKTVLNSKVQDCGKMSPENDYPGLDSEVISEFKCANLATIDQEITNIQEQDAILLGLDKLKSDIQAQQKIVAEDKGRSQQQAARKFGSGIEKAVTLESFINAPDVGSDNFLAAIKNIPVEKRADPESFYVAFKDLCRSTSNNAACKLDSQVVKDTYPELDQLLNKGPVTKDQLEDWRKSFAIKKVDGSNYSFSEMYQSLAPLITKLRDGGPLSRQELLQIKNLPKFESGNQDFPFIDDIKKFAEAKKPQFAQEKFSNLVSDLQGRSQGEMKTLIALTQGNLVQKGQSGSAKCSEVLASQFDENLDGCVDDLKGQAEALKDESILKMTRSLEVSKTFYDDTLASYKGSCDQPEVFQAAVKSGELPECLKKLDAQRADLSDKQKALEAIRMNLIKTQDQNIRLRDYALQKFIDKGCPRDNVLSSIGECSDDDVGSIPQTVENLLVDVNDIAIKNITLGASKDLDTICEEEPASLDARKIKKTFCPEAKAEPEAEVAKEKAPEPEPVRRASTPIYNTNPTQRNYTREAFFSGIGNAFNIVGNALSMRVYNPAADPYSLYRPQFYSGPSSNGLIYNGSTSLAGLGIYSTTPGKLPYTSFTPYTSSYINSALAPGMSYAPASGVSSSFYNFGN